MTHSIMGIRDNIGRLCAPVSRSNWVREVFATSLSVAALASTAITLTSLKDRPLPQWPLKITLNTLLSIYAVIFKASVSFVLQSCVGQLQWSWFKSHPRPLGDVSLYDAAGRGAWGSAMWLYTFHIQHPLAAFAALVSVISIATDPAFQQIIRFYDCPNQVTAARSTGDPDRLLVTAPRTNYVDGNRLYKSSLSVSLSQPAQSAINAGLFSPVKPLSVNCPTGNCTFEIFHTAGYCSTCHDVTSDLEFDFQCIDGAESWAPVDAAWVPVECNSTNVKSINTAITSHLTHVNGTTSSMVWNSSYYSTDQHVLSGSIPSHHSYQPSAFDIIMGKTYFSENGFDPLTGKPMEDSTCNQPTTNTEWRCRGYGAASCMMYPCVRSYNVSVQIGVVSQLQTHHTTLDLLGTLPYWNSSHGNYGQISHDFVIVDVTCLSPTERKELLREGYNLDADPQWLAYDPPESLNLSVPISPDAPYPASMFAPQRQCTYVFDGLIDYQLWNYFAESFFMVGNATGAGIAGADDPFRLQAFHGSRDLQALYNSTNISLEGIQKTFDNIADSFTAYIRTTGHPAYSIPAFGTALHYAVCLEVNWPWITLPAILAAGILILLPLTIELSAQKGVPAWKSSNLPLAFRGPLINSTGEQQQGRPPPAGKVVSNKDIIPLLDLHSPPSSENLAQTDDTISVLEEEARSTIVRLEQVQGESRLVLVERPEV